MTSFKMWLQVSTCVMLLRYLVAGNRIRGTPGVDYPTYTEIPRTSFRCSDHGHGLGFFADLETRCQVFHHCYEHRRESFLCPLGTIFNQGINACDYWYSAECKSELEFESEDSVRIKKPPFKPVGKSSEAVFEKMASLYESSNEMADATDGAVDDNARTDVELSQQVNNREIVSHGVENPGHYERLPKDPTEHRVIQVESDVVAQNMGQFQWDRYQNKDFENQELVYDDEGNPYAANYYYENHNHFQPISDRTAYTDSGFVYVPMDDMESEEAYDDTQPPFLRRVSANLRPIRQSSRPRPVYVQVESDVEQPIVSSPTRKRIRLNINPDEAMKGNDAFNPEQSFMVEKPSEMTTVATLIDDSEYNVHISNMETVPDEEFEYPAQINSNKNSGIGLEETGLESAEDEIGLSEESFTMAPFEFDVRETSSPGHVVHIEDLSRYSADYTDYLQEKNLESQGDVTEDSDDLPLEFDLGDTADVSTEWKVTTEYPFPIEDGTSYEAQTEHEKGSDEVPQSSEEIVEWDSPAHDPSSFTDESTHFSQEPVVTEFFPLQLSTEPSSLEILQMSEDTVSGILEDEFISKSSLDHPNIPERQNQSVSSTGDKNDSEVTEETVNETLPEDSLQEVSNLTNTKSDNSSDAPLNHTLESQDEHKPHHTMDHKVSDQFFLDDNLWPELAENPPLPMDFDSIVPPVNTLEHENKESLDKFFNHQSVIISELSPTTKVDSSKAFPHHQKPFQPNTKSTPNKGPPSNPQVFGRSLTNSNPSFMNFGMNPNSNYLDTVNFPTLTRQLFNPFIQTFGAQPIMGNVLRSGQGKDSTSGWSSLKLFAKKLMTSKKAAMDTFRAHYNSFDQ